MLVGRIDCLVDDHRGAFCYFVDENKWSFNLKQLY